MALCALLHGERLDGLVIERRTGWDLFDLVSQVDFACPGLGGGTHRNQYPGQQAAEAQVATYNMCCLFHLFSLLVLLVTIKKYRVCP